MHANNIAAIETIKQHPALADAKEWLEEQAVSCHYRYLHPFLADTLTLQDLNDVDNSISAQTPTNAPILIHPNHIALLSPEPSPPRHIVQLRLPQRPLKAPYFLSAGSTRSRPQGRTTRSAATHKQVENIDEVSIRHDSGASTTEQWSAGVKERQLLRKENWMHGMDEVEIMAVEGLMKMRWDVRGVGLRQQMLFGRQVW